MSARVGVATQVGASLHAVGRRRPSRVHVQLMIRTHVYAHMGHACVQSVFRYIKVYMSANGLCAYVIAVRSALALEGDGEHTTREGGVPCLALSKVYAIQCMGPEY